MLKGLIPPLCTPLGVGGEVDATSLESLIASVLEGGATGVFVLGSSGEAAYLDDDAREVVVDVATSFVGGQVPVLVGTLDSATSRVIHQIKLLERREVSGVVVTPPYYANPSPTEVVAHFRLVAAMAHVPVLAYDIPSNVGRRLPLDAALELLSDGVIGGLKDSSGSLTEFRLLLDALGPDRDVSLLTGADILADLALELGADGFIPGLANIRPAYFAALRTAHAEGDRATMAAYQRAITSLTAILDPGQRYGLGRHASELGALKHLLVHGGVIETPVVSPPMSTYPAAAAAEVDVIVARLEARLESDLLALSA